MLLLPVGLLLASWLLPCSPLLSKPLPVAAADAACVTAVVAMVVAVIGGVVVTTAAANATVVVAVGIGAADVRITHTASTSTWHGATAQPIEA